MAIKIHVEYCGSWGYETRFNILKDDLIKEFGKDIFVTGEEGRKLSYEVKINDQLVYSKLEKDAFPDNDQIADAVQNVIEGGQAGEIEEAPSMFWPITITVGVLSVIFYAVFKLISQVF